MKSLTSFSKEGRECLQAACDLPRGAIRNPRPAQRARPQSSGKQAAGSAELRVLDLDRTKLLGKLHHSLPVQLWVNPFIL